MKLITIVTTLGEPRAGVLDVAKQRGRAKYQREAMLAVIDVGGSFFAPVFDDQGELIEYYQGDLEKLGEFVSGFVTEIAQRKESSLKRRHPSGHSVTTIEPRVPDASSSPGPSTGTSCTECHSVAELARSVGGQGGKDEILEMLSALKEIARAYRATLNLVNRGAPTDALASSRKEIAPRPA
jgi:hypothetical protein